MGRPYGKIKRKIKRGPGDAKPGSEPFKIKFRGKDNAPLSMPEIQQGLLETVRKLRGHDGLRVKWATLYLTLIDEDGKEVWLDPKGEIEIYPYKSAADFYKL
jgi:hypothetical protein